jgi:dephospho-CoA kinase
MLRVGLTGGLGSGKSTVAGYLRALGAEVVEADELGRALMEPGQAVYAEIVRVFGQDVVNLDGRLNRTRLADLAFKGNRLQELNAIVHPAAIAAQRQWTEAVFAQRPAAIAVVESALIFGTRLAHQIPDAEKAARADYVLENNGDRAALVAQVAQLWERLRAESNKIPEVEF